MERKKKNFNDLRNFPAKQSLRIKLFYNIMPFFQFDRLDQLLCAHKNAKVNGIFDRELMN